MSLSLFPESIKHELKHPISGDPTGFTLELVSTDHDDVYQAQLDAVKHLKSKGVKEAIDMAMDLNTRIKVAAACIVGWTNTSEEFKAVFTKLGFSDDSYSPEKAIALLSMKNAGWIRAQVNEAIGDKERFFKSASNG
jgi:hypothetical protein